MSEPIIVSPDTVPAGVCVPGTAQGIVNLVAQYLNVAFAGDSFNTFNYGSSEPDPDNRDRPWFRTDASGYFIGWMGYFNGAWRRVAPYPIGSIVAYSGSDANFDGDGKGNAGTTVEGYQLCNGLNGSPDLRNRFIIMGNDYSGSAWTTDVEDSGNPGVTTGGLATVQLFRTHIPRMTDTLRTGNEAGAGNRFLLGAKNDGSTIDVEIGTTASSGEAAPHPNMPPYYALAYIMYNPLV